MYSTATASEKGASTAMTVHHGRESAKLRKRIGSTTYTLSIRFSDKATETADDKIFRLIEREVS